MRLSFQTQTQGVGPGGTASASRTSSRPIELAPGVRVTFGEAGAAGRPVTIESPSGRIATIVGPGQNGRQSNNDVSVLSRGGRLEVTVRNGDRHLVTPDGATTLRPAEPSGPQAGAGHADSFSSGGSGQAGSRGQWQGQGSTSAPGTFAPFEPFKPFEPLKPFKPFKPLFPPMKPMDQGEDGSASRT